MSKNGPPTGSPRGGPPTHFFAIFEPRATNGDPQGSKRSPRRPQEASKSQFGPILEPIWTQFSMHSGSSFHDFPQQFSHTNKGIPRFRARGQQPTKQEGNPKFRYKLQSTTHEHGNPKFRATGQQSTQQKGILSSGHLVNNLHNKQKF